MVDPVRQPMVSHTLARERTIVEEGEDRCIGVQFLCHGVTTGRSRSSRDRESKRCVEVSGGAPVSALLQPVLRVHSCSVAQQFHVQVWAGGAPGVPAAGDGLAPAHLLAWLYREVLQVCKQ